MFKRFFKLARPPVDYANLKDLEKGNIISKMFSVSQVEALDLLDFFRDGKVKFYKVDPEDIITALEIAECALSDIGDAEREPGDDVAWCEARAAEAIPSVRNAIYLMKNRRVL